MVFYTGTHNQTICLRACPSHSFLPTYVPSLPEHVPKFLIQPIRQRIALVTSLRVLTQPHVGVKGRQGAEARVHLQGEKEDEGDTHCGYNLKAKSTVWSVEISNVL